MIYRNLNFFKVAIKLVERKDLVFLISSLYFYNIQRNWEGNIP